MTARHSVWYQFRIITIVLASIVFLSFFWFYIHNRLTETESVLITNWTKMQYKAVEELVDKALSSKLEKDFDDFLVQTIVPKFTYTETSYGFLYKNGNVVFEHNAELTRKYGSNTIRNTYGAYSYDGGGHLLEVVERMENKTSGTDYFIKNHFKGREYVTWIAFNYYGGSYIIGIVTPEAYILNEYKFNSIKNDTYVFASIYTFIMILFAGMLCFLAYRYNQAVGDLEEDVFQKKEMLKSSKFAIAELEETLKQLSIKDLSTGVYNRKYFDALADKLKDRLFLPISICIIDIDKFKNINNRWGFGKGDEILKQVAEICTEACDQDDVIARYGNDEIVILMINTSDEEVLVKAKQIYEDVLQKYKDDLQVSISFGVSTKFTDDGNVYQTIVEAESNLLKNKP